MRTLFFMNPTKNSYGIARRRSNMHCRRVFRGFLILFSLSAFAGWAQTEIISVQQAVELALKNNQGIKTAGFEVESWKQLKGTSFDLPKTNVSLMYGQYNGYPKNDNNFMVSQTIPFAALGSQRALNKSHVASSESKKAATENELVYQVKQVYFQLAFAMAMNKLLLQQDNIYEGFLKAASFRYKTGETNLLEQTTAETQRNETKNMVQQSEADIIVLRMQLKTLMGSVALPQIADGSFQVLALAGVLDTAAVSTNPSVEYMRQQVNVAKNQKAIAPDSKSCTSISVCEKKPTFKSGANLAASIDF